MISSFSNREHLVELLLGGTGIPGISLLGCWHKIGGHCYCDGAFTCLAPKLSSNTILLSPWRSFQPKGFSFVLSPSKQSTTESKERPTLATTALKMIQLCFVAPTIATCRVDARRGYEDAKAAREMF